MRNKKIILILQARMDSRRFPKKILAKINGKPILWWVINRVKKVNCDEIIVATTRRKIDKPIIEIAQKSKVNYFKGSKEDVLDRYYRTAEKFHGDIIIRITADCPLIDYQIINKLVKKFLSKKIDYIAIDDKTFPKGMDAECFTFNSLKKAWINAKMKSEREHVTPYIWKNPRKFEISKIKLKHKIKILPRLVVDYPNDLFVIRKIFSKLNSFDEILLDDILKLYKMYPEIFKKNSHYDSNEGYNYSLKNDQQ